MNALYWCIIYLFDIGKLGIILFCLAAFPVKRTPLAAALLVALGAGLVGASTLVVHTGLYFMLLFWLITGGVMAALVGNWRGALLILPAYLLVSLLDNLVTNLSMYASGTALPAFSENSILYLSLNFYTFLFQLCLLGLAAWLAGKFPAKRRVALNRRHVGILSLGLLVLLCMTMLVQQEVGAASTLFGSLAPILFLVVYLIVCVLVLLAGTRADQYKARADMNEQLVQWQKRYYEALLAREHDTRRFKHDMRHHFHYIRSLSRHNRWEEIGPYLDTLTGALNSIKRAVETGHDVLNCIVDEVFSRPAARDVELVWKGSYPAGGAIADIDLCVLFSNLLVNAVEATAQCEANRQVCVEVKAAGPHLYITVANPVRQPVAIVNNRLQTAKHNQSAHGFGTQSIQGIAGKYNGEALFSYRAGYFTCELFFLNLLDTING